MHLGEQEHFCMQIPDLFSLTTTYKGCKQMLRQDFVVFTAAAIVQFLSLSVRSYRNLYLQVLPRYLSRYFTSCFYKGQLFRLNTWIRHATRWGGTGRDAGHGRRLPRSRPTDMAAHLLPRMLGNVLLLLRSLLRSSGDGLAPAAGGGTGTLCPQYGKRGGRAGAALQGEGIPVPSVL